MSKHSGTLLLPLLQSVESCHLPGNKVCQATVNTGESSENLCTD